MYSRRTTYTKIFLFLCFVGLFIYTVLLTSDFHPAHKVAQVKKIQPSKHPHKLESLDSVLENELKYILIYTTNVSQNFGSLFKEGRHQFKKQRCVFNDCYLTSQEHLLNKDIRSFHAVVINVTDLGDMQTLPKLRSINQKYVFYGMEPSDRRRICRGDVENYFNWTWSYKLFSDIVSPFFYVKNLKGEVVAPKHNAKWSHNITSPSLSRNRYLKKLQHFLEMKKNPKAIATHLRNCNDEYGKIYLKKLRAALNKYDLELDIFECDKKCPNDTEGGCGGIIKTGYYFFLVQETTLTEDYLTDKVLEAYFNHAVPIVKSGADLDKFLPKGSYINALHVTPEGIAAMVYYIIQHPRVYLSYFFWKEFYTFHTRNGFDGICQLCELLNDPKYVHNHRSYDYLRKWWYNGPLDELCGKNIATRIGLY